MLSKDSSPEQKSLGSGTSMNQLISMLQSSWSSRPSVFIAKDCIFLRIQRWIYWIFAKMLPFQSYKLMPFSLAILSISFNRQFSYLSSLIILSTALSLIIGLFFIFFVWSAYLRVDRVSSQLSLAGEMAQIIVVTELPPSAVSNIRVNADYR